MGRLTGKMEVFVQVPPAADWRTAVRVSPLHKKGTTNNRPLSCLILAQRHSVSPSIEVTGLLSEAAASLKRTINKNIPSPYPGGTH
ncbi:hypothetical protein J6590_085577 [Homalodisca vitripennis]|nr:hypothetical protein J6590_085577 [Homalodisca vitripennis]